MFPEHPLLTHLIMTPPGCDTPIPATWALAFSDVLADYMVARFQAAISTSPDTTPVALTLPLIGLQAICEANYMVDILVSAYKNPG
jgi:hypothetical protein